MQPRILLNSLMIACLHCMSINTDLVISFLQASSTRYGQALKLSRTVERDERLSLDSLYTDHDSLRCTIYSIQFPNMGRTDVLWLHVDIQADTTPTYNTVYYSTLIVQTSIPCSLHDILRGRRKSSSS